MKDRIYLETSVVSYYTSKPSRNIFILAKQELTKEWWEQVKDRYDFYISEIVREEISQGNSEAAKLRGDFVRDIPNLTITKEIEDISETYIDALQIPENAIRDALHIAIACFHKIDFLVTWNSSHIANGHTIKKLYELNNKLGIHNTILVTPDELLDGDIDE